MSVQNNFLRAEMEVSPRLQAAIVVHHILQVVSPVAVIIIYVASLSLFPWLLMILISAIIPAFLFIIFWIASKCNYQDLRTILVHFNAFLSTLWFLVYFPFFILCSIFMERMLMILVVIITGFLSLSSAFFATYGIWKSARNVVLSARFAKDEHNHVLAVLPPTYEAPVTFTDLNGIRIPPATFNQLM
ncbi:hypothetical protein CHS0354_025914 [Potamilus streckersoni]|uniref:Uncharacterized protein n=1 Tax=Potamilus streckersoni TaxID=2493646 RepID=A0AAE0T3Y9_9BIVA|nr:hypothetical protein CHS0354_025914 [Potamilus streckersoni]